MKRTVMYAALAAATSLAWADPPAGPPPGGPRGGPPIERLAKDLGLDSSQQAQVKAILDAQRAKRDADRAQFEASGTRPSREEMRAKHEQNDADVRQQLSGVLTAEQLAKFDEMRKRRPMRAPPDAEPGQSAPPAG